MTEKEFIHIVPQMRSMAIASARRVGLDADSAEDVAQEVSVRLWQMHEELERYGSLTALVRLMARRLSLNILARPQCISVDGVLQAADGMVVSGTPAEELECKEAWERFCGRMATLPSTQQAVFYMRQVERRGHEEIGRLLGIEPTSVSTLLARARKKMFDQLDIRRS